MISPPRRNGEYADREIDCQEAMEPGFQAIVDCMLEAGWTRGEIMRSLRWLIAADNMTQKENAKVEAQLAIARAMMRLDDRHRSASILTMDENYIYGEEPACSSYAWLSR
ncbi:MULTISPECIES: hypothetical protein [unclassified Mesorhizobium]